ncbi:MAG: hypothetical protein PHU85_20620, partial [Phycisphaerae bacterium]|nr:hypothetical protein [Phycisphaerae bacterium]
TSEFSRIAHGVDTLFPAGDALTGTLAANGALFADEGGWLASSSVAFQTEATGAMAGLGLPSLLALGANGGTGGDPVAAFVIQGATALEFQYCGGQWLACGANSGTLSFSAGTREWKYADADGNISTFSAGVDMSGHHFLVSLKGADGSRTEIIRNPDNMVNQVKTTLQDAGVGRELIMTGVDYTYTAPMAGVIGHLPATATQWRSVGKDRVDQTRTTYSYYGSDEDYGNPGDVKTVVVTELNVTYAGTDTSYYRYYKPDSTVGYTHGLMYVVGPDAYNQLAAVNGGNVLTVADISGYADRYFEYDAERRVTKIVSKGGGSSLSGGFSTSQFTYGTGGNEADWSAWTYSRSESRSNGTNLLIYANYANETMATVLTSGQDEWVDYYAYDSFGRQIKHAYPSAVEGYDPGLPDVVELTGGGLVEGIDYGTSTTATAATSGDVLGRVCKTWVGNNTHVISSFQYEAHEADGATAYFVSGSTAYAGDISTDPRTVTYDRTWSGNGHQVSTLVTHYPAVAVDQNGSGQSTWSGVAFNAQGQPIWTRDQDGFLTYTVYDDATGGVKKVVEDADSAGKAVDLSQLPAGCQTPQGGGKNVVTTFVRDKLGRLIKSIDANGTATQAYYMDSQHEVRTWSRDSAGNIVGPVQIQRQVYLPSVTTGYAPTFTESLSVVFAPEDDHPTGTVPSPANILSLSRTFYNAGGQAIEQRSYADVSGYDWTQPAIAFGGTALSTTFQYDANGLLTQTNSPGQASKAVYDALGRVQSNWIGGGGSFVELVHNTYDNGGTGDGLLTESESYSDGGMLTTSYEYDGRDRLVGVRGPDGVITRYGLNNLGETTAVNVYADINHDQQAQSDELR